MTAAIVVPARYASTRYQGKPLAMLKGAGGVAKPLIERSWEAARAVSGATVVIATDDVRIAAEAERFGAAAVMTPAACANGTERCAAALDALDPSIDVIVNLQGDALLTPPEVIEALLATMAAHPEVEVATPAIRAGSLTHARLLDDQRAGRVGGTTLVTNAAGDALYFSKAVIPHIPAERLRDADLPVFLHLGVYAYRRSALTRYVAAQASVLEQLEGLEQLRFLDIGVPVRVVEVDVGGKDIWELNNPQDVAPIEAALAARGIA